VNGRDTGWVRAQVGHPRWILGEVRATLPATPPSRLEFIVDVPDQAQLSLAAGIPRRHRGKPGVEFMVKARSGGRETVLLSRLVDPANRPEDQGWLPLQVDLSGHSGRDTHIILETRGFEKTDHVGRAFWGTPTITASRPRSAALAVVYLVDTLRADHLPLYGYPRDTAPELGRFARDGIVFDQAIAPSSWTKPSVASLLTSLLPREHRCVQFYTPLDPAFVTLAELLRERGFGTGAVVANRLVHAQDAQFHQGFEYFTAPPAPQGAREAVDTALAYLRTRQGLPTFLYVHTMDPHTPYTPPPPFDRRFEPAPAPGRAAAEPQDYQEPADRDRLVAQYDGEIAYGDRELGRFLRELKSMGRYEGALVIFLSDHGEEFLDHGDWVHGHTLYDELIHVPLVVKMPLAQHAGRRVSDPVQLVDILPTILKAEGLPVPETAVGRPLGEALGGGDLEERPLVLETKYREHVAYGVRTRTDKYVHQLSPKDEQLYLDLGEDPHEQENRLGQAGPRVELLRRLAERALAPAAFRYQLRIEGGDRYQIEARASGWIDSVETRGLGPLERAQVDAGRRRLTLSLQPSRGQPREIGIRMRPHGVLLTLDGTRAGRPLRPSDIRFAGGGVPAEVVPFLVPDAEEVPDAFSPPPRGVPGIAVWLTSVAGGRPPEIDGEARGRLRALGYIR
jgi:arylsulfatase A-like enzyme